MANNPLLDMFRIDIPCPNCGEKDMKIIRELIDNQTVACSFCGDGIDISSKEWRAFINETADTLRHIRVMPPR